MSRQKLLACFPLKQELEVDLKSLGEIAIYKYNSNLGFSYQDKNSFSNYCRLEDLSDRELHVILDTYLERALSEFELRFAVYDQEITPAERIDVSVSMGSVLSPEVIEDFSVKLKEFCEDFELDYKINEYVFDFSEEFLAQVTIKFK